MGFDYFNSIASVCECAIAVNCPWKSLTSVDDFIPVHIYKDVI